MGAVNEPSGRHDQVCITVNIVIVGMDRLRLTVADCDTFANFVGKTSGLVPDVSVCEKNSVST